jgi:D-Tyr-tRNAtyr deacylase
LHNIERREDTNADRDDSNNSVNNLRQVQDDLAKLNQSLEEIKGQLKILVDVSYLIIHKI